MIIRVCVIGVGNLGRAMINYFSGKRTKLSIVAVFDSNTEKVGKKYSGVTCYDIEQINDIVRKEEIKIAIMTVPADQGQVTADRLVKAGIKGILNYAPKSVFVPKDVHLEEYDMITSLEKVAFFVKTHQD
jgi:redox-sensing transcriptional repressor